MGVTLGAGLITRPTVIASEGPSRRTAASPPARAPRVRRRSETAMAPVTAQSGAATARKRDEEMAASEYPSAKREKESAPALPPRTSRGHRGRQEEAASQKRDVCPPERPVAEEERLKLGDPLEPGISTEESRTAEQGFRRAAHGRDDEQAERDREESRARGPHASVEQPGLREADDRGGGERGGVGDPQVPLVVRVAGRLHLLVEEDEGGREEEADRGRQPREALAAIPEKNGHEDDRSREQERGLDEERGRQGDTEDRSISERPPRVGRPVDERGRGDDPQYERELQKVMVDRAESRAVDEVRRDRDSDAREKPGRPADAPREERRDERGHERRKDYGKPARPRDDSGGGHAPEEPRRRPRGHVIERRPGAERAADAAVRVESEDAQWILGRVDDSLCVVDVVERGDLGHSADERRRMVRDPEEKGGEERDRGDGERRSRRQRSGARGVQPVFSF